ncbi:hypothetical protein BXY85_1680 [Roseivirga pacifica]|uniref:Uncharacterized protein n=1 Tax=Roseivirga pacifica TaxID=1267423 RepID=A0A1I0MT44_9BACT|nr:hypothetical protein BXY85_1680 [Roseivirga pacifica]SEV91610.1 hypothetical protein SAMN05216290_0663 [Roseivirga pacifica]
MDTNPETTELFYIAAVLLLTQTLYMVVNIPRRMLILFALIISFGLYFFFNKALLLDSRDYFFAFLNCITVFLSSAGIIQTFGRNPNHRKGLSRYSGRENSTIKKHFLDKWII